ncbi:hypothetical protein JW899_01530 [Candidatus Uhrbacteria bacterium]|nr:hypothetical protein [Candidatus Uhrbacteria bacterium]
MAKRGIGLAGVASQLGSLDSDGTFSADREELLNTMCIRFEAERWETERALNYALKSRIVYEKDGKIILRIGKDDGLNDKESLVYAAFKANPTRTIQELQNDTGLDICDVDWCLDSMIKLGLVKPYSFRLND